MTVHMHHPGTGGEYQARPSQVEFLKASGWQATDPDAPYDEWPEELQRFEGQAQVVMRHPNLDGEIIVAESAEPFHASQGWQRVEDIRQSELEDQTVEQLKDQARERGISPLPTKKADLIEALSAPDTTDVDETSRRNRPTRRMRRNARNRDHRQHQVRAGSGSPRSCSPPPSPISCRPPGPRSTPAPICPVRSARSAGSRSTPSSSTPPTS